MALAVKAAPAHQLRRAAAARQLRAMREPATGSPVLNKRLQQRLSDSDRRATRIGQLASILSLLALTVFAFWFIGNRETSPTTAALTSLQRLIAGQEPPTLTARRALEARTTNAAVPAAPRIENTPKPIAAPESKSDQQERAAAIEAAKSEPAAKYATDPDQQREKALADIAKAAAELNAQRERDVREAALLREVQAARDEARREAIKAEQAAALATKLAAANQAQPAPLPVPPITQAPTAVSGIQPGPLLKETCVRDLEIAAQATLIAFEVNSAAISPIQGEQLKRFANLMRACPTASLDVAGHTDLKGAQERNFGLSWQRAEAVVAIFVAQGVDAKRLTAVGYGPRKPLSQSADPNAYNAVDRRVELFVR